MLVKELLPMLTDNAEIIIATKTYGFYRFHGKKENTPGYLKHEKIYNMFAGSHVLVIRVFDD